MLKLKKFPSDNTFFLIVFFSILSFLFFIICFFSLSCLFLRSGKRKIVYKKNFAQKSFFSSGVVKESELKKDYVVEKISTKKTIEGDDFSDSYCDGLFQEFFIGHSLNSSQGSSVSVKKISVKERKKNSLQKISQNNIKKNKVDKKKEHKNSIIEEKKNSLQNNKKEEKKKIEKKTDCKVSSLKMSHRDEKSVIIDQKNNDNTSFSLEKNKNVDSTFFPAVHDNQKNFSVFEHDGVENNDQLVFSSDAYEDSPEEKEVEDYTQRLRKHVKQFPGKKQKISLLLRATKEKMVVLSFIPEPKSIAYRNYLIELLQSTEVPRILRDQEIHIFL